ncbi:MAG: response regulator [Bacteroidota bacterium]
MKKILLCDDDGDISTLMQLIVSSMDLKFASVQKITDIVKLVNEEKPDLILMDLWIPDIGGEQAVKDIKADEGIKKIPVLLFSATDKLDEICEQIGADGCIKKPFDVSEFKTMVNTFLNSRSVSSH